MDGRLVLIAANTGMRLGEIRSYLIIVFTIKMVDLMCSLETQKMGMTRIVYLNDKARYAF
jgi:integrase